MAPSLVTLHTPRSYQKFLSEKYSACEGDAYPFAIATKGIRLHLDLVQTAFYTCITGLYP